MSFALKPILLFQNQINGESSSVQNHTEREICETENLSMLSMEFSKDNALYDFSEEHVRQLFLFLFFYIEVGIISLYAYE